MTMLLGLARLHDVGKIAIPKEAYLHEGKLTAEQWEIVRTHSEIGYRLAFSLGERLWRKRFCRCMSDGTASVSVRLEGRSDSGDVQAVRGRRRFDAMTHDRLHASAIPRDRALQALQEGSGSQFDPRIVGSFEQFLRSEG